MLPSTSKPPFNVSRSMYHSSEMNNPIFPSGFSGEMIPNYDTNLIPRALRTVGTQRKTRIY